MYSKALVASKQMHVCKLLYKYTLSFTLELHYELFYIQLDQRPLIIHIHGALGYRNLCLHTRKE